MYSTGLRPMNPPVGVRAGMCMMFCVRTGTPLMRYSRSWVCGLRRAVTVSGWTSWIVVG